ncbi:MAG: hypothetical protein ACLT9P_03480 [Evtepia gabavorous]
MAVAGVRELSQPSMESSMGTPAKRSIPETIWVTTWMAKKKATDSNILCWAKLWPMARGVWKLRAGDHTGHAKEAQASTRKATPLPA